MKTLSRILQALLLASVLAPAGVQAQMSVEQITTIPASPISSKDYVTVLVPVRGCSTSSVDPYSQLASAPAMKGVPTVAVTLPTPTAAGVITISVEAVAVACAPIISIDAFFAVPVYLKTLPRGAYTINYTINYQDQILPPRSRSLNINVDDGVTPTNAPLPGLWAITSEVNGSPGRGFQLEVHGQTMVLTFYGYDSSGKGRFWLASGFFNSVAGGNSWFDGTLRTYDGGTTFGGPAKSAQETGNAGAVSLTFTSPTTGTITLPGESPKDISYFQF